jgi:Asp-tRNA(Asn)/Glu-tRNA(Gln) amidotransferase A subunit family amidase
VRPEKKLSTKRPDTFAQTVSSLPAISPCSRAADHTFYPNGLPFGLEISARKWRDGDLLGWAYAYEQATKHRRPPVLVEKGLLPEAK